MGFLTLQRQITQLRRERAELSDRLYLHALADEDPEALIVYRRLQDLDSQ